MTTDYHFSGLYIHFPFCQSKCRYCDFYSQPGRPGDQLQKDYISCLKKELSGYQEAFSGEPVTCFFGGGTPTLLEPALLAALLDFIKTITPLSEVTIECNPDDLDLARLQAYRQMGFSRLSLGLQSLFDADLLFMGRRHNAAQGRQAFTLARQAGFTNISCDLITGLPGQTIAQQQQRLAALLELGPEHISCYQLTINPGTPLYQACRASQFRPLAESRQAALLKAAHHQLTAAGYHHYEVSNYCRPGYGCAHNLLYWQHRPYLGLGAAAHSFDGRRRWWNKADLHFYMDAVATGKQPQQGQEELDEFQLQLEKVSLLIRTTGGLPQNLVKEGGRQKALENGYIHLSSEGLLYPTLKGLLIADYLPLMLLELD